METTVKTFNLRVYGLLINKGALLVTDECRGNVQMTKFPGGGLEKGEGLAAGLIREFDEELGIKVKVSDFFYVNDFLQLSAFNPTDQLISFYFFVETEDLNKIKISSFNDHLKEDEQIFRWVKIPLLESELFNFPIDKIVVEKMKAKFS